MPIGPKVDEVRRVREDEAAKHGSMSRESYGLEKRQRRSRHKVVSFVPEKKLSA